MTPEQIVDLLTLMAARDRRTVGKMDVIAWHSDIGDLDFTDAQEAVSRHFQQSNEWLMPADIRRIVKQIREQRLDGFQYVPVEGDDNPQVYLKNLREQRAAVASGHREAAPPPPAVAKRDVAALLGSVFPRPPKARPR